MLTKNWKCVAVLCALTLSLTAVQAQAASIGIDVSTKRNAGSFGGTMVAGDQIGAVVVHGNWTSIEVPTTNLQDSNAAATTLDISWTTGGADNDWQGTDGAGSSIGAPLSGTIQNKLFDGLFDNSPAAAGQQVSVSEIPYDTYDLYVYFGADFCCGGRGGFADTGVGGESVFGINGSSGVYDQTLAVDPSLESANYALWSDLSEENLTLSFPSGGLGQIMFFGLQVVDTTVVPEPSTLILLSTGLLGLVASGRRRRRRRRA